MDEIVWLCQIFASYYGLQVFSAHKVRDAWRVQTSSGPKCFKRVKSSLDKVLFTAAALEYLINNGFSATVPFLKTLQNSYAIELPEGVFYATEWLPGREGDFSNLEDIQTAAKVLARIHIASRGFVPPEGCKKKESWGEIPNAWQKYALQLTEFRELANAKPNDHFNQLYLSFVDSYQKRVDLALNILNSCDYFGLVESAKKQGSLCHRDYTYHNFLVDDQGTLNVIDFDYCTQDIRAYDVGRFIRKVAKHHKYNTIPVKLLLDAYQSEHPLDRDELIFVLAFVHFPQRFWRLATRYYCKRPRYTPQYLLSQLEQETQELALENDFLLQLVAMISREVLLRR
ncbi:MAG TPA: CotS family spore coat protein [Candidatus Deferrimicrobium sp.]|nr:CotS family spore coat protein [Candidatus Deferrimicrobium sp.]